MLFKEHKPKARMFSAIHPPPSHCPSFSPFSFFSPFRIFFFEKWVFVSGSVLADSLAGLQLTLSVSASWVLGLQAICHYTCLLSYFGYLLFLLEYLGVICGINLNISIFRQKGSLPLRYTVLEHSLCLQFFSWVLFFLFRCNRLKV